MSEQNVTDSPEARPGVGCSDLLECLVVTLEHEWLCIRNRAGWLLWSSKKTEIDLHRGVVMADIANELKEKQTAWQEYNAECEKEKHSNDGTQRGRDENAPPATETQSRPSLK